MKFSIVGAGSSYSPELIDEMINRREKLPVDEIVLYDISQERLDMMEGFLKRYTAKRNFNVKIRGTRDLDDALYGADFVDTQIRVGGNQQRVIDEKIPLKYGLIGQETTGAGGMMKAFRTIPVMVDVARHMEKVAPDGWIINYTNPAGLITEAVTKYTNAKIAGFCSGGIFPKMWAKSSLGLEYNQVQYDYVGLNHLNFISHITIDGRPVTEEEFKTLARTNDDVGEEIQSLLGCLTSPYLQYYYKTAQRVHELENKKQTRGEYVQDLEKIVFKGYNDTENADIPEELYKRGGGGYSEVAMNFVNAVYNNEDTEMVVNVPNRGAVPFLPDEGVVEINCLVNRRGMSPIHKSYIPAPCWGLIAAVKNYEMLAVEAAYEGNFTKMKQALLAHPLVREYSVIEKLAPELLEGSKEFLPQFKWYFDQKQ